VSFESSEAASAAVRDLLGRLAESGSLEGQVVLKGRPLKDDSVALISLLSEKEKIKLSSGADIELKGRILAVENEQPSGPSNDEKNSGTAEAKKPMVEEKRAEFALLNESSLGEGQILVNVQQENEVHQVIAKSIEWTVRDLKLQLQPKIGAPSKQMKLLIKGKVRGDEESLKACGVEGKKVKVMLLFTEGYHRAEDGGEFLQIAMEEISRMKIFIESLQKQLNHRLVDPFSTIFEVDAAIDRLENLENGLHRPVPHRMQDHKVSVLQSIGESLEKLRKIRDTKLHGQK